MVMKDATALTPLVYERTAIFECKQHTIHDSRRPAKYINNDVRVVWGDIQPHAIESQNAVIQQRAGTILCKEMN